MFLLILKIACTLLVVSAAAFCLYQIFLAVVALACEATRDRGSNKRCLSLRESRGFRGAKGDRSAHSFAIVIPAHNEEDGIAATLRSCEAIRYPRERLRVYVVADNCTDRTAEIAARHGATVLAREDDRQRGKGYALEWAFPRVLADGCDALLVLDADCQIDAGALEVFDRRLAAGDRALQANDAVSNPDESPTSYVLAVANLLENELFYAPKSALGLTVFLRGTGMAFHREVLAKVPWQVRSIVEDTEYTHRLLEEGIRVRFVPEVRVTSAFPAGQAQLAVQRARWIGGAARLGKSPAFHLFCQGLARRSLLLLDAALTMLVVSRPRIILHLTVTVLAAGLCYRFAPSPWSQGLALCSLGIVGLYALYAAAGILRLGITRRRASYLVTFPLVVVRYVGLTVRTLAARSPSGWNRTPRAPAFGSEMRKAAE